MVDDLSGLGPDGFERLCRAIAVYVLGAGLTAFGDGPDGGREATFEGRVDRYPSQSEPWDGLVVLQAKFKSGITTPGAGATWLREQIKKELDAWSDPAKKRARDGRRPDYLIFATNISLSGVPGSGGKDRIAEFIRTYAPELGLKDFGIWDGNQIRTYLDSYPEIRKAFSTLVTSNQVLAKVLADMSTPTPPVVIQAPEVRIRPGQPGLEAVFGPVYEAAGGAARFGRALGEVAEHAPGWVQHFEGGQRGEPAVLCSADGRTAVAVARSVWHDLCGIGIDDLGAGTIGVGFPAPDATAPGRFIGSDSTLVELVAGQWGTSGRGQLIRSTTGPARWQPKIAFDRNAFQDRDTWGVGFTDKRDLRLRVAARIPLIAEEWRITHSDRARMVAALDSSGLVEVLGRLAGRYDLHHVGAVWAEIEQPDGINNSRFTAHQLVVHGAGDRPALAACARLVLPDGSANDVRTTVDLRVDFSAIEPSSSDSATFVQIPAALRLTIADLTAYFVHAWQTATTVLPLVAGENPLDLAPSGAPRLEVYVQTERPGDHGDDRVARILDMIDFGPLGTARRDQLRELSIGITTPLTLTPAVIESTVTDALVRMTEDAGFAPAVVVHP